MDVALTRRWPAATFSAAHADLAIAHNEADVPWSDEQMIDALQRCTVICPTVTDRLGAHILETAAPNLKTRLLANFGVGYNHIDVAVAKGLGIQVSNTPDVLTDATADLAMMLLLMCARRAGEGERELRAGAWEGWRPTHLLGQEVTGRTLGIVGMGRIGTAMARRAHHGFGMKIIYHNRSTIPEAAATELAAERVGLSELLERSDFVSLHCPASPETRQLIDADALASMRRSGILINTARGDVVDEAALAAALHDGTIAGAGLDVYAAEPSVHEALLASDRAVLLPHLGSATEQTRVRMGQLALDNVLAFARGQTLPNLVTT